MKTAILSYLMDTYAPESIITYGSYADGSANENSDFDALVIAESSRRHDESVVCGVTLDVFIYSAEELAGTEDPEEFIQIFDGKIELDRYGAAKKLQDRVLRYIAAMPKKSPGQLHQETEWCRKMLLRTVREDAEGYFRWHWLLTDSLEICCDLAGKPYFGPKKALKQLAQCDPESFEIYRAALMHFSRETLCAWMDRLVRLGNSCAEEQK